MFLPNTSRLCRPAAGRVGTRRVLGCSPGTGATANRAAYNLPAYAPRGASQAYPQNSMEVHAAIGRSLEEEGRNDLKGYN